MNHELDLYEIESRARATVRADPWDRPARETLRLIAEVRRLQAAVIDAAERLNHCHAVSEVVDDLRNAATGSVA